MGNTESHDVSCDLENEDIKPISNKKYFYDKYNWIPSHPGFEFNMLTKQVLDRKFDTTEALPGYVDLRNNFPQIQSIENLPFNSIISVVYMLHYQLLKNNLPIFPPSGMYIYKHIEFYRNIKALFNFEIIFNSIKNNGFCSENEFPTIESNLDGQISNKLREKSMAFKFIDVYRVKQELDIIKIILKNEYPILIGLTVYYDLSSIDSYLWMPDKSEDKKLGGISGVLVGYIDERKMFIMATTFGKNYGMNGYVLIPYDYVLDSDLTGELYTLDFKTDRVLGYITQRKEMVNLQNNVEIKRENKKQYQQDTFGSLFK